MAGEAHSTEQPQLWDTGEPGKVCTQCKKWKPYSAYSRRNYRKRKGWISECNECKRAIAREWTNRNKEKAKASQKKWAAKNKDRVIANNRRKTLQGYGLTTEQYASIHADQNGVCAICKKPEQYLDRTGKVFPLSVDHDHDTGEVRGLLCMLCNTGIGKFYDNPEVIRAAAAYLEAYRARRVNADT